MRTAVFKIDGNSDVVENTGTQCSVMEPLRREKNSKKTRYVSVFDGLTLLYAWNLNNMVNQTFCNMRQKVKKKNEWWLKR